MVIGPPSAAPTRETIGASKEYMGPVCNRGRRRRRNIDEYYSCCHLLLLLPPPLLPTSKGTSAPEEEELMDTGGTSCRY